MDIRGGITKLTSEQSESAINREKKKAPGRSRAKRVYSNTGTFFSLSLFDCLVEAFGLDLI